MAITVLTDGSITNDSRTLSWTIPTLATGDVVVVLAMTWDSSVTLPNPSGTGLAFGATLVNPGTGSHDFHRIWAMAATAGGSSVVVTCGPPSGSSMHTGVLLVFPAADGYTLAGSPNVLGPASNARSGSLTGTSGNAYVVSVGDWNGGSGAARTWFTSATEDLYAFSSTDNTQYYAHGTLTGASTTVGLSAPAGTGNDSIGAVEILLSGAAAPIPAVRHGRLSHPGRSGPANIARFYKHSRAQAVAGPISVDVDPAILSLSGVDGTASGSGAASQTVDVATLTLTGVDATAAGTGAASVTADVAALTLTGVDPTGAGSGAATVTADVAALTLTGVDPAASGSGAASVTSDVAALTLTGVDATGATSGGPQSVAAGPATLTLAGVDATASGSGAASVAVDVATLTLSGIDATAAGTGASSNPADVAVITLTGITPTAAGTGAATQAVDVGILVLSGVDATGASNTTATVDVAALTLVGVTPTALGSGTAAIVADTAVLTLSGVDPAASGSGAVAQLADTATLTLTGVEVIGSIVPIIVDDPNPITVTIQDTGHTATVTAERARTTVGSQAATTARAARSRFTLKPSTHATTKENR